MSKYIIIGLIFSILFWNARAQTCNELTIPNKTFSTSKTIGDCKVILDNVSITNKSTVIINSNEGITITGGFNVELGSTFEMNDSQSTAPSLDVTHFATSIGDTFAYSGGKIFSSGGSTVIDRGVCWSTSPIPTVENDKVFCGTGPGSFSGKMTGLTKSTNYYYRAYAINQDGFIGYSPDIKNFTTLESSIPVLDTTDEALYITQNYAVSGGRVLNDGGIPLTKWGVCWSTSPSPTINDFHTEEITSGVWGAELTDLIPNTKYYVRSYGTNTAGTGYGAEISFTTLPLTPAALTQTAPSGGPTSVGVQYTVTLGSPAEGTKYFSVTHTNTTNSGTTTENITVNDGQTVGNLLVTYNKQVTAYNAVCDFNGTQEGYTNTSSQLSYSIPALSKPTLATTTTATSITQTTAVSGGNVTNDGGTAVTERGICWSTSPNPTIADSKVTAGSGTGSFSATMTGLIEGTTYHVRSYATNSAGIAYGAEISFNTIISVNITSELASANPLSYVVIWKVTLSKPALNNMVIPCVTTNATNTGTTTVNVSFSAGQAVSGANAVDYTRQVGTNFTAYCSFGTMPSGYAAGNTASYSIPALTKPSLATTTAVTSITQTTAVSGGNVTSDGGTTVTERGICWSTSQDPTIADSKVIAGSGTGSFTASMTGLSEGTTYYVRSFAKNSGGYNYGGQVGFTTLNTVNITSELASVNPASYVVIWKVTLAKPALNNMVIPCVTTNATNTGTTTVNVSFSAGQPSSGANAVEYPRQPGTNFTAYCSFGTMPAGYTAGSTASYVIPMPDVVIPTLAATNPVTSITQTTAVSGGNVTSGGGGTVTERGICWSTSQNPTTSNSKATAGSGTGSFSANLSGLSAGTTYYVRAYATNSAGTAYGTQVSFTTSSLITAALTQASVGGGPTSVGIQYTVTLGSAAASTKYFSVTHTNTSNTGTTTENITVNSGATTGTLTITYNKQASAYNAVCDFNGTQPGYTNTSSQLSYLIPNMVSAPTLASTTSVTSITQTSGTSGGNVTSDGGATVTERGICWSTSQNPTTSNSKVTSGSGTGSFSASMSGLSANTTYYVRSYATNSAGTGYGAQVSFTTLPAGITVSISYQVFNVQPTSYVVGWFANLTSPAPASNSIPVVITNANGVGTYATSGYVAQGQQSSIALGTVTYSRLAGSSYNATCTFGTLPSGYVAGSTGVVSIPKQ